MPVNVKPFPIHGFSFTVNALENVVNLHYRSIIRAGQVTDKVVTRYIRYKLRTSGLIQNTSHEKNSG